MNSYGNEITSVNALHSPTSHMISSHSCSSPPPSSPSSPSSSSSSRSPDSMRAPSITGLPQLKNLTATEIANLNKNPLLTTYSNEKHLHYAKIPNIITTDLYNTNDILQTNGQLLTTTTISPNTDQWDLNYHKHYLSKKHEPLNSTLFCGPGRKRYLIAFLCCTCLTIVIGMRSEMLGIITNLNNTHSRITLSFKYSLNKYQTDPVHFNNHYNVLTQSQLVDSTNRSIPLNEENIEDNEEELHTDSRRSMLEHTRPTTSLIFKPSEHRKMPWTETIKNDLVENSVFFAYLITSPIGGYLTVNYDSSFLLGSSVAITCGMNLFLPLVETIGNNMNAKLIMIILLRLIQGLAEGCLIPAVFGVLRFWSPENERSTLVCLAVIGVSLGPLIGLPVCAEIEKKWGWGVVFYIYANLGLIWCIFWWRLIDEKPNKDKKLSKRELNYLKATISNRILYNDQYTQIPWQKIFTSRSVYAILFTYAADDWTFQISSVCMQSFYQQIYNVDVERTIFFLSFPFLSRSMFVPIGKFE
ncbi:unnamed protein product [Schistosoma turkestanicum]|nr:unnamed protein product [Schistosoma turkestanicum]